MDYLVMCRSMFINVVAPALGLTPQQTSCGVQAIEKEILARILNSNAKTPPYGCVAEANSFKPE